MQVQLRILGPDNKKKSVLFEAGSEADAIRLAVSRGVRVLAIENKAQAGREKIRGKFPLLLFSQELLALLEAGLNLNEAAQTLLAKERQVLAQSVLQNVLSALQEGRSFSDALAQFPKHFPEVYIATVRASERTGDLPHALSRFINYQLQFDVVRKKLISASIYPAMLLVAGSFVMLFLLGYVVPKFSMVYESSGRELPLLSAILLRFGKLLHDHWLWFAMLFFAVACAALFTLSQDVFRKRLFEKVLELPWLVGKVAEFRLARFYRSVGLLLASGIPLVKALVMVDGLLTPNQRIRLGRVRREVEEGQMLSSALHAHGLSTPVADSLLRVGENAGRLADMMERIARFQDDDFARWVDWFSRLLEPVLMAFIGIVIGLVVVLMYMPIFELAGGIQ
jgi:general secretion pathway protein F